MIGLSEERSKGTGIIGNSMSHLHSPAPTNRGGAHLVQEIAYEEIVSLPAERVARNDIVFLP